MTGLRKNIQEINSKFVGKGFYFRCITRNMTITFDKDIHVNASDIIAGICKRFNDIQRFTVIIGNLLFTNEVWP